MLKVAKSAINMAMLVNMPKYMDGTKFDRTNMIKPKVIVIDVK